MERVRTSTLLFVVLLAWSKVLDGCPGKTEIKYVPGPPGPPGEVKTVYVNVPATLSPALDQHIKASACFQKNAVHCYPYKYKCRSCFSECNAAAQEYCRLEGVEVEPQRRKRSSPVGPPRQFTSPKVNIQEVLMRHGRIAAEFDSNQDGQLSDQEFQLIASQPPEQIIMIAMDGNDDGLIDTWELMQAINKEGLEVPEWEVIFALRSLDTDRDGAVSRDEWINFFERFDHMLRGDWTCGVLSRLAQYVTSIYDQE